MRNKLISYEIEGIGEELVFPTREEVESAMQRAVQRGNFDDAARILRRIGCPMASALIELRASQGNVEELVDLVFGKEAPPQIETEVPLTQEQVTGVLQNFNEEIKAMLGKGLSANIGGVRVAVGFYVPKDWTYRFVMKLDVRGSNRDLERYDLDVRDPDQEIDPDARVIRNIHFGLNGTNVLSDSNRISGAGIYDMWNSGEYRDGEGDIGRRITNLKSRFVNGFGKLVSELAVLYQSGERITDDHKLLLYAIGQKLETGGNRWRYNPIQPY
ncbi:MAG: hypothetical protein HQ564_04385 [Candidatus Saganbacteria bacterium]|nr:hypothetical protein [Candidatus Saganbacteria bacterium]